VRQSESAPRCLVLSPASATWEPRSLFLLREDVGPSRIWEPLLDEGWTLVAAQSISLDDGERAREQVRGLLADCARLRGITTEGMVIAGVSRGAPLAIEAAHEAGVPWLCVIPSFPRGYDVGPLTAVPSHTAGSFLLGEHDPENVRAQPLISQLQYAGVKVAVRVMPGAGHELPGDFAAYAAEALRKLYGAP
jgi:predicted esterase